MSEHQIASADTQVVWATIEETPGVYKAPDAAGAILVTENVSIKQEREFLENKQRIPSLSKMGPVAGIYHAGEWAAKCYVQPSGAAGVAPVPGQMLKALLGRETVTAGTKVTYSPARLVDDTMTLSMVVVRGWDTLYVVGALVAKGTMSIKAVGDDALLQCAFSGPFLRLYQAGTDNLAAQAASGATTITVSDAKRYDAGSYVVVGSDDNAGKGFRISAVDAATNTLTIDGGLTSAQSMGALVKGWTPAIIKNNLFLHGRFGLARSTTDGTNYRDLCITEASIDIDTAKGVLDDEKTGDAYPRTFKLPGRRDVAVNISKYFYMHDSGRRFEADKQTSYSVELPVGDQSQPGKCLMIKLPNWQHTTPDYGGDAEMTVTLNGKAYGTSALDDEISLIFS